MNNRLRGFTAKNPELEEKIVTSVIEKADGM